MFWQWGMSPLNSDANNIEVAANDVDYQTVVLPAVVAALQSATAASPLDNCNTVRQAHLVHACKSLG